MIVFKKVSAVKRFRLHRFNSTPWSSLVTCLSCSTLSIRIYLKILREMKCFPPVYGLGQACNYGTLVLLKIMSPIDRLHSGQRIANAVSHDR